MNAPEGVFPDTAERRVKDSSGALQIHVWSECVRTQSRLTALRQEAPPAKAGATIDMQVTRIYSGPP